MLVLSQFVLRLAFGLALAMALTSPRKVTSGFFRNHAYVLLGLNVLATLVGNAQAVANLSCRWLPLAAAILSYVRGDRVALRTDFAGRRPTSAGCGRFIGRRGDHASGFDRQRFSRSRRRTAIFRARRPNRASWCWNVDRSSGMLLGTTIAAMFLGHWYLNTPTMELSPLRWLLLLMAASIALRAMCNAWGLALELQSGLSIIAVHSDLLALDRRHFRHGGADVACRGRR